MRRHVGLIAIVLWTALALPAMAQTPSRDAAREQLRATLASDGPKIGVAFRQSDKNPYNFVGSLTTGLKNSDSYEIVISVSDKQTIHFRIYPHYSGGYINVLKARDNLGLARKLLLFNDTNFLYWGADETSDIFAGYTFTLESGYPDAAVRIVLESIPLLDQFVGQMRPFIDGSNAS